MNVGHKLHFSCQGCSGSIIFSVLDTHALSQLLPCPECGKKYAFDDEVLLTQLKQFEALCKQIHQSASILGKTSVAIDVGTHHVKVPFNILLTRLSSVIELNIGGKKTLIEFRVDPLNDIPQLSSL